MKIAGIIAEFNPFHNGHAYLINEGKRLSHADRIIVAMSGDYVQRGEPAIMDKALRARCAMLGGADMVLQLPLIASTASAEFFARSGVASLAKAGCTTLIFGVEDDNTELLKELAKLFLNEPIDYQDMLKGEMRAGLSFPASRAKAAAAYLNNPLVKTVLEGSNNILAIEYIKAIMDLNLDLELCPVKRVGNVGHNDNSINEESIYSSATSIRSAIKENKGFQSAIPASQLSPVESYLSLYGPMDLKNFDEMLYLSLLYKSELSLCQIADSEEGLINSIKKNLEEYQNYDSLVKALHKKQITEARVKRFLLHALLNIEKRHLEELKNNPAPYIRVLGAVEYSGLLSTISKAPVPVITKVAEGKNVLKGFPLESLKIDEMGRSLYTHALQIKKPVDNPLKEDCRQPLIIL